MELVGVVGVVRETARGRYVKRVYAAGGHVVTLIEGPDIYAVRAGGKVYSLGRQAYSRLRQTLDALFRRQTASRRRGRSTVRYYILTAAEVERLAAIRQSLAKPAQVDL